LNLVRKYKENFSYPQRYRKEKKYIYIYIAQKHSYILFIIGGLLSGCLVLDPLEVL